MDKFTHTLVNIINEARTNPATSSELLYKQLAPRFHQDQLSYFNKHIETFQGISALEDYKHYMNHAYSAGHLIISNALNLAAQEIATEKGQTGRSDHQSPKLIYQKICKNGQTAGKLGELMSLKCHSSEQIATYFLIDDGLATRKRRRMLLDPEYKFIGVGTASHKHHEIITVIILAESVKELNELQKSKISQQQDELSFRHLEESAANKPTVNDY